MPWFRFITRYAWLVLAIALGASVASVFAVQTLVVDNDPETWLLISSDEMESYREYKDNFGNDEYLVVGYRHAEGVLSEPALDIADRLTTAFEKMDGVLRVTSLANVEDIRSEDDLLSIGPLVRRPVDGEQLKDLLGRLASDPLFARTLASDDGRA